MRRGEERVQIEQTSQHLRNLPVWVCNDQCAALEVAVGLSFSQQRPQIPHVHTVRLRTGGRVLKAKKCGFHNVKFSSVGIESPIN